MAPQSAEFANRQMIPVSQAPAIALDGFCPVTLREVMEGNPADRGAWRKGDRRFGAIHNGRTYLFASAEQQQKFLASPDAYAPVLSGCDPVLFAERGQMVDGKRAYGLITGDHQIYLFADESSLNRFKQAPENYAGAIQQARARTEQGNVYR
jgi:protein disulfide-isomerase